MQEIHAFTENEFLQWLSDVTFSGQNKVGYRAISSAGTSQSSGVAILYHPDYHLVCCHKDQGGCLIGAEFERGDLSV